MRPILLTAMIGTLACAGTVTAQSPERDQPNRNQPRERTQDERQDQNRDQYARNQSLKESFTTCDTLLDASIKSERDTEHEAEVDELIMDTRNGRILYAIVDTNEILGSEDKIVALPYGALAWDAATKTYRINASTAQLAALPKFDEDNWKNLQSDSWWSSLRGAFGDRSEFRDARDQKGDEYTMFFHDGRAETMKGHVVSVDRQMPSTRDSKYCAVVLSSPEDNQRHVVLLAPVEYLDQQSVALPKEGSEINVTTIKGYNAKGEPIRVAQRVTIDGKTVELRDDKGVPKWKAVNDRGPFYLERVSALTDGSLMIEGEEFGDVNQVIFEPQSGQLAFYIISVGGVLGIDDTLYPVPDDAVTIGQEDNLYIDMSKSKFRLAPKLSGKGTDDLNVAAFASSVYDYYGAKRPDFDLKRSEKWCDEDEKARDKDEDHNEHPDR